MRLLFLTTSFPTPAQPTKGVFNLRLVQALARRHEVTVVAPVPWVEARGGATTPAGPRRDAGAADTPIHHPRYWYTPKVLRSLYGWFLWRSVRGTVLPILDARPPDAVVAYWAHPDGAAALRAARIARVPAVVMVGGSDVLLLTRDARRRRRIVDVLRGAAAVVSVGADLKEKIVALGVEPGKVHVTFRGVDGELFSPGDREEARSRLGLGASGRLVLWVGRMVPVKGLDVLLDACARLRRSGVGFHLALVGDGPLRPALEARADALGLGEAVTFVGGVTHERLPDWFRAADVTVLPSLSEGVPNVLRESLACGTPFVASRVGGIPDLARGTPSRLVPPEDPAALASALAAMIVHAPDAPPTWPRPAGWDDAAESLLRVIRPLVRASRSHVCPA